jgi:Ser/Thr protein kinase RdoA (MazF antagonist)
MSKEDFYDLTPNEVLNAVESAGFQPTGEFSQLNSYENRVFDVRLEDKNRVVAKFYRPGRWSKECILEEHEFLNDLNAHGLPAVAPLELSNHSTLMQSENSILFALWPKAMGRMVDELQLQDLEKLGRTLARFHNIGELKATRHRPIMNAEAYGWQNLDILENWVAPEVGDRYFAAATRILNFLDDNLDTEKFIRIHGDCHRGNILKSDVAAGSGRMTGEFFFLDFDDFCMGHPLQDFWMLLSDDENSPEGQEELSVLAESYSELRNFDENDFDLLPALRGLRILHYAAWIARRWEDPSFPKLFPQFLDYNYWATETEALEKLGYRLNSE